MSVEASTIEPGLFRAVMGRFVTGVNVIGYFRDGAPAGLTANAFMSVSLNPPLVLVSIRNASAFLKHIRVGARHGISMLTQDQQDISDRFGGRADPDAPSPFHLDGGVPLIEGALAAIVARVVEIHPAGDHSLVVSHVETLHKTDAEPLVFFGGKYAALAGRIRALRPFPSASSELLWWSA